MKPLVPTMMILAVLDLGTCEQVERTVCLNEELNITCVDQDLVHQWTGTALSALGCIAVSITPPIDVEVRQCGNASVEELEGGSRLTVTADSSLDGTTVVCTAVGGTVVDDIINIFGVPLSETAPNITSVVPLNQTCVEVRLEGPENGRSCLNNYTVEVTCNGSNVVEGSVGGSADSSVLPVVVCPDKTCPNDPCTYTAYGQSQWFGMGHTSDPLQVKGTCPGAPSGLTDTTQSDSDPSNVTVVLEWSPTVGFPGECFEYTITEEGSGESQSTSDVSLTWSGLRLCNTYSFTASASAVGCPPNSTSASVQLGAPVFPSGDDINLEYMCGGSRILVTWNAPHFSTTVSYGVEGGEEIESNEGVIPMDYDTYTATVSFMFDTCSSTATTGPFVPNIILAHELILTSNTSAEISVTYADCVDDTSDFMVEVKYWRDGSNNMSLPLEPLSTSVFVLSDLMPGSVYWYEIRVTQNSSGAQIGDSVTGLLTTFPPPSSTSIATPTATPTVTPTDTGTTSGSGLDSWIIPVAVVVGIVLILLALGIVGLLVFLLCCRAGDEKEEQVPGIEMQQGSVYDEIERKEGPETGDLYAQPIRTKKKPKAAPATAGAIYQDPNTIEHEAGPETGEMYAQLDRSRKKKKPKATPATAGAIYQDPNTIEHEAGPETGEMYAQLDRSKKKKKPKAAPATAGAIYQDPNTIEHEAGPETGEMYAQLDRSKKKKKPKAAPATATTGAVYQDPNAIEHEAAPGTGDTYAIPDKPKRGGSRKTQEELDTMYSLPDKSKKKINPELLYADVSVGPPRRHPAPPPKDNEQVLYSTITHN